MKYWTMAHTCCPQFVIGRSVTCTSGALSRLSDTMCGSMASILADALVLQILQWRVSFQALQFSLVRLLQWEWEWVLLAQHF